MTDHPNIDPLRLLADIAFELAEFGTLTATTREQLSIASCGVPNSYENSENTSHSNHWDDFCRYMVMNRRGEGDD